MIGVVRQVAKVVLNYRGQRQEIVRRWVFDLLGRFSPSIAVERDGVRFYVDTSDRELGRSVFALGNFEEDVMLRAVDILEWKAGRQGILQGRTVIDVGANIGTSTITALKLLGAGRALAIEPAPGNFTLLRCNLVANGLAGRARALRLALSDQVGTALLELSERNSGDHRIIRAGAADGPRRGATVTVLTARFDDVIADLQIDLADVGLVWMDAQGHEGHILAGAETLLRSEVPVVLEYWPSVLAAAGGLATLHELVAKHYDRVFDLRASIVGCGRVQYPAAEIGALETVYRELGTLTDLLLVKDAAAAREE